MRKELLCKVFLNSLLLAVLLLVGLPVGRAGALQVVHAEDYQNLEPVEFGDASATKQDHVQWAVYDTDGDDAIDTLVISGQGAMDGSGWKKYKENMQLIIEDGITTISSFAFYNMNLVGDLTLPVTVTNIKSNAFSYCKKLDGELKIKGELQELGGNAFYNCSNLTGQIVLPQNAQVIEYGVYSGCKNLTGALVIPDTVKEIGDSAFYGCSALEGELPLLTNVEKIGAYAFDGCSGLTGDIVLSADLEVLENSVFYGCSNLSGTLNLPESLTRIGDNAFFGCSNLTGNVTIPVNVKVIPDYAFYGCSKLDSINFGDVESIGKYAFYDCTGWSGQLKLSDNLTSIGEDAFNGCSKLTGELKIPDGIKEIKSSTFRDTGFTSVKFSKNLEVIGANAFFRSAIQSDIVIPEGVTQLGNSAFDNCSAMQNKTIIIPYSVTSIGSYYTFYGTKAKVYNLSKAKLDSSTQYTLGKVYTLTKVYGDQTTTRKFLPADVYNELNIYHKFPIADYDDTENIIWYRNEACTDRITGTIEITENSTVYGKEKAEQENFAIVNVPGLVYGGNAFTLTTTGGIEEGAVTFSVPEGNGVLELDGTTATIVGAGTVTVTAVKAGNADYKPATATLTLTVNQKEITEGMVGQIAEQRYTGKAIVPTVEVKDGDTLLKRSVDYTISYTNNIDICDKEADNPPTATITGIGNYAGEVTRTFTIMRPQAEVTIAAGKDKITKTYGDSPFMLEGVTKTGDGALVYNVKDGKDVISVSGDGKVTILKAGNAVIGVTTQETIAYSAAEEKTISITINKAPYAPFIPMSKMYVERTCETIGAVELPGKWEWSEEDKDTPLEIDKPVSVTAFYNGDDKGNYVVEDIVVSVTRVDCVHEPGNMVIDVETCERDRAVTCTEAGYGHKECTKCRHIIEVYIEVPALGHTGGIADCIHKAVCDRCHKEYGEIDSTRHDRTSNRKNVKAATCTEDGYTGDVFCKDCGEKLETGTAIKAEGHKWDAGQVTKAATAVQEGVMTYTCSVCKKTRTEVIPKSGELPKVGSTFTDPATKAKYKITGVTVNGDVVTGTLAYIKPTVKNIKKVNIATSIKVGDITFKVTSVASKAFKGQKKLSKVTIGSNVTSIGAEAFSGCKALKTVKLGGNVTTIGNKAFYKCTKLTKITISAKVTKIGSQAFGGCKALKSITIKTKKLTTKNVGKNAFKGISVKATVKVPKSKKKAYKTLLKKRGVGSKAKIK